MSDHAFEASQYGQAALRAEYEQEARALGWMKKSFLVMVSVVVVFLVVLIAAHVPSLEEEYGAEGVGQLVRYLPVLAVRVLPVVLYIGCVPSGYIWAARYIRRHRVFMLGNVVFLALVVVLLVGVPAAISPALLAAQWLKVSKLKSKLA